MCRFMFVIVLLLLLTPFSVMGADSMQINFDTQRAGGDYRNFYADNYKECARQCEASARCRAFDFHRDHSCWLKSHAYAPRYYGGVVSGVKRNPSPRPFVGERYRLILSAQQILTDLGYRPGYVDGQMGRRTRAALRNYQYDNGLPPTGELDTPTLMAMGLIVRPDTPTPQQQEIQKQQVQPQTEIKEESQGEGESSEEIYNLTNPEAKG